MNAKLADALGWIATKRDDAIEQLIRWCNQNSWSMDEPRLRDMAELVIRDFGKIGVEFQSLSLPPLRLLGEDGEWMEGATGPALLWHHNPQAKHRVLLMIHYDTVYPSDAEPNFCVRVDGHGAEPATLVGPGVADAKGGIAVIALAVEAMLRFDLLRDIGVSILLNPDEEIGSTASATLMQELASQFAYGLVFEPTLPDGTLVAARKGSGNFAIYVRGRSAHAGRNIEDGRNAIVHLANIIVELNRLHDPDSGVSVNVGQVSGGGPLNQVPDLANVKFNIRVNDRSSMERMQEKLHTLVERLSTNGFSVAVLGEFHSPPKLVSPAIEQLQAVVMKAGKSLGRPIQWRDTGGACDGSKLAGWGLPNIDTMSVTGGNLHSPQEYMQIDSLTKAAQTVVATIQEMASR
ncbi:Carboxypeptidase G2 precursor [Rubripirellula amarantea]|uniref:Carboxypeptidase G2 n=1 Tax=Rubripirellula amarantea TaxID=2527999 RepID=A0A5C5WVB5_9BACT|nr:hydrolase [Rubripirellula amarantea]TWT53925.1 Carboxypeptidase G2 precursor [Rubripirellula amarantea]